MRRFESCHPSHLLNSSAVSNTTPATDASALENSVFFTGSSNPELARSVARELGISLGEIELDSFSDGEVSVELLTNVRGKTVYIIQSTCKPANDHLLEMLLIADAAKRAVASKIIAVMPYFGYARQDRRPRSARVPISARLISDLITSAGVERLLTVELHVEQIQGFFNIPVDNIYGSTLLKDYLDQQADSLVNPLVVSPDIGGVARARAIAKILNTDLAIIDKRRQHANQSEVMNIIGDPADRDCLLVDDMIDTAGTTCQAASALKERGALRVIAHAVHPILSGRALDNINNSELDLLLTSDTIPLSAAAKSCPRIRQLSIDKLLAHVIRRTHSRQSLSAIQITG